MSKKRKHKPRPQKVIVVKLAVTQKIFDRFLSNLDGKYPDEVEVEELYVRHRPGDDSKIDIIEWAQTPLRS